MRQIDYLASFLYLLGFNLLTAVIGRPFFGQKSPAVKAKELFKPSTDSASLLVGVFWRWRHNEGMFSNFWPPSPGP